MTLSIILAALLQLAGFDNANHACGQNAHAQKLASLIMGHESQHRTELECNELLAKIAAERAAELVNNSMPQDLTPNQILTNNGFRIASFYPPAGNQVEAVAAEVESPEDAIDYLVASNKHRDLILGNGEFFSRQSQIGVGFYKDEQDQTRYVVLIAEAYSSPKVVIHPEFEAPKVITNAECVKTWRFSRNDEFRKICRERWQDKKDGH